MLPPFSGFMKVDSHDSEEIRAMDLYDHTYSFSRFLRLR